MSTKEIALQTIQGLQEDASWEMIEERIHFMAAIERGRRDIREGKVVPHQEVKDSLKKWISN